MKNDSVSLNLGGGGAFDHTKKDINNTFKALRAVSHNKHRHIGYGYMRHPYRFPYKAVITFFPPATQSEIIKQYPQ